MQKQAVKRALLVLVAVGVFAAPVAVIASHQFTDVPNDNIFHDDIGWMADTGVTRGCNPPTNDAFCPDDEVTREQMSAFMRRFAQYLGAEDGIVSEADNANTLDGLDSTDFLAAGTIVTSHHPTEWMDSGATTNAPVYNPDEVDLAEPAQLGLTASNEIGGTLYGLAAVELCYSVSGTATIAATQLQAHVDDAWSAIVVDSTVRSSTTSECYMVDNIGPLHADSWNVYLVVTGDDGSRVSMRQVQAYWEPTTTNATPSPSTQSIDDGSNN